MVAREELEVTKNKTKSERCGFFILGYNVELRGRRGAQRPGGHLERHYSESVLHSKP